MNSESKPPRPVIGWREWVALPGIGISAIKAKVDTGARSSALHAFDVQEFMDGERAMVRFKVHPWQRDDETTVEGVAELIEHRTVRSSAGSESLRPVVLAVIELDGQQWPIELTLVRPMGFVQLVGVNPKGSTLPIDLYDVHHRELRIHGAFGRGRSFKRALTMMPCGPMRIR